MAELPVFNHEHTRGAVDEALPTVVRELMEQKDRLATPLRKTFTGHPLPSRTEIVQMVDELRSVIFPGFFGNRDVTEDSLEYHLGAALHRASLIMVDEIHRGLCFACGLAPDERMLSGRPRHHLPPHRPRAVRLRRAADPADHR